MRDQVASVRGKGQGGQQAVFLGEFQPRGVLSTEGGRYITGAFLSPLLLTLTSFPWGFQTEESRVTSARKTEAGSRA